MTSITSLLIEKGVVTPEELK
ncbi:hypothetical protein ACFQU2_26885 [Siccirubricoccus deserti]